MDISVVSRYLKTSRTAAHPGTGAPERDTARRIMAKMEAENPGIGQAAKLLDRIERDDLREPPPPPPPPGGFAGASEGVGWQGAAANWLRGMAERPDVQAAAMDALRNVAGAALPMPDALGRKAWRVDRVEGGHEGAVTLVVQVDAERLITAAENERLEKLILKVVAGVSAELEAWVDEAEEEDDDDSEG